MKQFWMKNKVLIATLCAVLVLGIAFWGGLRLFAGNKMQDALIRTSATEAAAPAPVPQATEGAAPRMPVPTAVPTALPPAYISQDILHTEWRYDSVLPRISNSVPYEAKTWKEGVEVEDDLATAAVARLGEIYEQLLGRTLDLAAVTVSQYWDRSGYREDILRLTDSRNDYVCVLAKADLRLLIADNALFAASDSMDQKRDAERAAAYLGSTLTGKSSGRGGSKSGDGSYVEQAVAYELADGRWITLAYTNRTLHGVQVHPDYYSMEEIACFQADIRISPEVVHLVAPEAFEPGRLDDIAEGDMTPAEAEALYRMFLSAANSRAEVRRQAQGLTVEELDYNLKEGEMTYFLDKSGYRENYYHIEKKGLVSMDIAAKSGYIVRAKCNALYNLDPALDLTPIDYDHMGGLEYIAYVRSIVEQVFGKDAVKDVDVNAVYDGNYCTIDAYMTDGRWYEFGFTGGKLMYIEHFATDRIDIAGWGADALYVNTVTGEEFTMEW